MHVNEENLNFLRQSQNLQNQVVTRMQQLAKVQLVTGSTIMKRSSNSTNILKYLVCPVCAAFGSWFVKNVKVTPSGISTVQGMINDKAVTRNLDTLTTFESSKLLNHA